MSKNASWLLTGLLLLSGCNKNEAADAETMQFQKVAEPQRITTPDIPEELASSTSASAGESAGQPAETEQSAIRSPGAPQIAYTYEYGFRVSNEGLSALQQKHAGLCEKKGQAVCRVISMSRNDAEGEYGYGNLKLEVVANKARTFGSELTRSAEGAGGEQVSMSIAGEDLSKQIVDTEARLRARILLRDRLMEVLRTRQGSVADLVAAERGVADVNEEIDKAQSWLAEMKGRVSFSDMDISYNSGSRSSGGFFAPIASAFTSTGSILGQAIGALIIAITALLPFGIVLFGIVRLRRAMGWTWPRRKPVVKDSGVE